MRETHRRRISYHFEKRVDPRAPFENLLVHEGRVQEGDEQTEESILKAGRQIHIVDGEDLDKVLRY